MAVRLIVASIGLCRGKLIQIDALATVGHGREVSRVDKIVLPEFIVRAVYGEAGRAVHLLDHAALGGANGHLLTHAGVEV